MFKNLNETIIALNKGVKNVANCEKAKKLRKKLLSIGLPLAIGGFLGLFVCFVLFATAGFDAFGPDGFTARIIVPFVLFLPCGIIGGIGSMITSFGLKIVIAGYTTNLIDETIGNNCPTCGDAINSEMLFCSKCGTKLKNECSNCKHINHHKNDFCEKCGTKLKND